MFTAKKSLGQNFLKNQRVLQKIVDAAGLTNQDIVIEIGPGMGALTEHLLKAVKKVIAIEKDMRLFEILNEKFAVDIANGTLELINGDALKIPPPQKVTISNEDNNSPAEPQLDYGDYKLVANIPYYITSPLIDHFVRDNPQNLPGLAVLLVQKEVAEKICAKPPHMSVLALHVQTFGDPKIIAKVSRNDFSPAPKVDSAILKIEFSGAPKVSCDLKAYFDLIHCAFSHKRKMLRHALPSQVLLDSGISLSARPETLSVSAWERLIGKLPSPSPVSLPNAE